MNDKEKVEAIKKLLSINTPGFQEYARYVGIIHNILDEKINQKLIQKGYNILRFWEHDINENPEKCIRKIIKIIKEARR